jgi:hypothetical protein
MAKASPAGTPSSHPGRGGRAHPLLDRATRSVVHRAPATARTTMRLVKGGK